MGFVEMIVYSLVGALAGAAITFLALHYSKVDMKAGKRAGVLALWILGLIAVAFGIDWAYASTLEVEPQSAAMGLLIFGGIGIVLGIVGYRLGKAKPTGSEKDEPDTATAKAETA